MKRFGMLLLIGCGDVSAPKADAKIVDTNGMTDQGGSSARCDPSKPFAAPTKLANVNSTAEDNHPFLTADELELWFTSDRTGSQLDDIYMATRASKDADFGPAALVAGINTGARETRPTLTADGLTIYIQYIPAGGTNPEYKIRSAVRGSRTVPFPPPTEVTQLSSAQFDDGPYVLPDHSAIYFLTGRDSQGSLGHIYRSARVSGTFQTPVPADGVDVNTYSNDYPTPLPDEKTLYFLSGATRPSGAGGTDNWKATRASAVQAYGAATNLTELNAPEGFYVFFVTADDCIAYLGGPGQGSDIYVAKKPL